MWETLARECIVCIWCYSHSAVHVVFHVVSGSGDANTTLVPGGSRSSGLGVWPSRRLAELVCIHRSVDHFGNANRFRKDVDLQIIVKCV